MLPLLLFIRLLGYTQATALTWGNPGLIPLFTDGRIVGGEETTIESFPHQVSLRYFSWHRCGGCVDGIPLINMAFVAGSSDVTSGGETRKLSKSIVHENYNDWTLDSDIAVVILQSGFDFSSKIQPIALASANEDLRAGTRVLVSGWGTISENGAEPDILRSDQTAQFESAVFTELDKRLGTNRERTTPYHHRPQMYCVIERFYHMLKAERAIFAKSSFRPPPFEEDLVASQAEMLFGTTLRVPGEFFATRSHPFANPA
ncbi:unnamed protein product [Hermetia illucens]|uniref:Peptidase S1 domain-containing protein n=1 Tax=Hermetia illucens TaxID=343691 RepID=A0A7R8UYB8_HERIL|nr:unnamed protein product [Hermetia illucens]